MKLWVEIESARFSQDLTRFAERYEGNLRDLLIQHAFDLQRRTQARTPVKTGRLKNSIHVVPPDSPPLLYTYSDNQGRGFTETLGEGTGPLEALVGTNVTYALFIEEGTSRIAPRAMFTTTLVEKRIELRAAIALQQERDWTG